mmetsp:Transcript_5902/g.9579  ORF Transcript_5902/g.9579 Transcript_5902/m.9579 type:complete len:205 (-) Transcript_5902:1127-1741(-)
MHSPVGDGCSVEGLLQVGLGAAQFVTRPEEAVLGLIQESHVLDLLHLAFEGLVFGSEVELLWKRRRAPALDLFFILRVSLQRGRPSLGVGVDELTPHQVDLADVVVDAAGDDLVEEAALNCRSYLGGKALTFNFFGDGIVGSAPRLLHTELVLRQLLVGHGFFFTTRARASGLSTKARDRSLRFQGGCSPLSRARSLLPSERSQ